MHTSTAITSATNAAIGTTTVARTGIPLPLIESASYLLQQLPSEVSNMAWQLQHGGQMDAQDEALEEMKAHCHILVHSGVNYRSLMDTVLIERLEHCFVRHVQPFLVRILIPDVTKDSDGDENMRDDDEDEGNVQASQANADRFIRFIREYHRHLALCFKPWLKLLDDMLIGGGKQKRRSDHLPLWHAFLRRCNASLFERGPEHNNDAAEEHIGIDLETNMKSYFEYHFLSFEKCRQEKEEKEEGRQDGLASEMLSELSELCSKLQDIDLYMRGQSLVIAHVCDTIDNKLQEDCSGKFDEYDILDGALSWLRDIVFMWIDPILPTDASAFHANMAGNTPTKMKHRLLERFYHQFCNMRIGEIFDVIVDFPESRPALLDLRSSLERMKMHHALIQSLSKAISKRLLHAGASTRDIVTQFINVIRALTIVDPTGISTNRVVSVIGSYLCKRKDAVRYVISEIISPDGELFEELKGSGTDSMTTTHNDTLNNADDITENWQPVPMTGFHYIESDRQTNKTIQSGMNIHDAGQPSIIKILVNSFPSIQMLVDHYQFVLAREILSDTAQESLYDTTRQALLQELLKIRFGEDHMHKCEVMIKDMSDSRRLNRNLKKVQTYNEQHLFGKFISVHENASNILDVLVLSRHFWPEAMMDKVDMEEEKIKGVILHPDVLFFVEEFEKQFKSIKAPRYLVWLHSLCRMELDVELDDGHVITFHHLSPIHGSLLLYMVQLSDCKQTWSLEEMSQRIGLDEEVTSETLQFFLTQPRHMRVLRRSTLDEGNQSSTMYHLLSSVEEQHLSSEDVVSQKEDGVTENVTTAPEETEASHDMEMNDIADDVTPELSNHAPIIVSILQNFSAKPLEELHSMLDMFDISLSLPDLSRLMKSLVQRGEVQFDGSIYSA